MKLLELELCNFQSFEHETIDLQDIGIVSIIGQYKNNTRRSNGSGKSTILDSILYCLYGKSRTKDESDLIRENQDEMYCKLQFELGKDILEIHRGKNKKKGFLNLEINSKDETEGKPETQKKINKKIGMDFDLFVATVFFQQESADKFTSSTPLERKNYLKNLLKLEIYDQVYEKIGKKVKVIETENNELNGTISFLKSGIENVDIKELNEDKKNKSEELEKLNIEIQENEEKLKEFSRQKNQLVKLEEDQEELIEELSELDEDIDVDTLLIKKFADAKEKIKDIIVTQKELDNCEIKIANLGEEVNLCKLQMSQCGNVLSSLISKEEKINSTDRCPILEIDCDKFNSGSKKKLTDEIDVEILKYNQTKENVKKEMSFCENFLNEEKNKYKKLKEMIETKNKNESEKEKIEFKLKETQKSLSAKYKERDIKRKKDDALKQKIDETIKLLGDTSVLARCEKDLESEKKWKDKLIEKIATLKAKINSYKQNKENYDECKEKQKELNWKLNCYNVMKNIFGKNGITAQIIKNSIDEIEYESNQILKEINNNEYEILFDTIKEKKDGDIADTLDIWIRNNRAKRIYESYSGGQRAIINFAIRMSLSKILSEINNVAFGFIALDEIFGQLDEYNKEKMIDVISFLKKDFHQIFVITHDYLKEIFKNNILVEYDKRTGISQVKEII